VKDKTFLMQNSACLAKDKEERELSTKGRALLVKVGALVMENRASFDASYARYGSFGAK